MKNVVMNVEVNEHILMVKVFALQWADQGPTSAHTASHMAQTNRRPAEDVGNHDQGRPGTDLRTASLRPRTTEKGRSECL